MSLLKCHHCENVIEVTDGMETVVLAALGGKCPVCKQCELGIDSPDADWMGAIYKDETLWYPDGFDRFPTIIAHEYWRLKDMFVKRQPYGALFQIRDVMETVIKYEILAICAWADSADIPGFQESVGCKLTDNGMTLGKWHDIGRRIIAFFEQQTDVGRYHLPVAMADGLRTIVSRYGNLIAWRNERIGHGALGFEDDDSFRIEMRRMIGQIKAIFEARETDAIMTLGEALAQQTLCLGDVELTGHEKATQLHDLHGELSIRIADASVDFSVDPYIVLVNDWLFFFDNQKSEHRTQRQCYLNGYRRNEDVPFFTRLMKLNTWVDRDNDVSASTRIRAQDDQLDQLMSSPEFVRPEYLVEWMGDMLSSHDKGVFLLKMPRGSGKSSFTRKINRLYKNPWVLSQDVDVRAYHISRTQMISERDFARQIEEQWRHDYENKTEWTGYTQINDYVGEGKKPSEALAKYLEECLVFTKQVRKRERILMVIDGLDEVVNDKLWAWLPTQDQLSDGVYLLLTSRDPESESLPQKIVKKLASLTLTNVLSADMAGDGNRRFLKSYGNKNIDAAIKKRFIANEIETMMQISGYRVLYFGMLCKLVNAGVPVSMLPVADQAVSSYLKMLKTCYGEKEYVRLKELLSVLCTIGAEEALSLRELAGLLNNGVLSYSLMGQIRDIEPLLKIQRGFEVDGRQYIGENRYAPANSELAESIKKQLPEWEDVVAVLLEDVCQRIQDCKDSDSRGDGRLDIPLLVLAHAEQCGGYTDDIARVMRCSEYVNGFGKDSNMLVLQRMLLASKQILNKIKALDAAGQLLDRNILATVYFETGKTMGKLCYYEDGLEMYRQAISIREALDASWRLTDRNALAALYTNTGWILGDLCRHVEALKMYYAAIEILVALDIAGELSEQSNLAIVYDYMAVSLISLSRYDEALDMAQRAIRIFGALDAEKQIFDRADWANAYIDAARSLSKLGRHNEALEMNHHAFEILKAMDDEGRLLDRNVLATVYNNMALVLSDLGRQDESLEQYFHAVDISEALDAVGRLPDRRDLGITYNNMALELKSLDRYDEALEMFRRAIRIRETLDAAGRLEDREDLVLTYKYTALTLEHLTRYDEALEMDYHAISILEELDAVGRLVDRNDLAIVYVDTAGILNRLAHYDEALKMNERALDIIEELNTAGIRSNDDVRISLYLNEAETAKGLNCYDNALSFMLHAFKRFGASSVTNPSDCQRIVKMCVSTADILSHLTGSDENLKLYRNIINILEALDAAGQLSDRSILANLYGQTAEVLRTMNCNNEALEYESRANEIQGMLE